MVACLDWEKRLLDGRSLIPKMDINRDESNPSMDLLRQMSLPDVSGQPKLATHGGDWFMDFATHWFGAVQNTPSGSKRTLSEAFILVPKKNSKTSYSAALMLVHMLRPSRPEADYVLCAPTREISNIAWKQCVDIIECSEIGGYPMQDMFHVQKNTKEIRCNVVGSRLRIISADTKSVTGLKCVGILVDETHEFVKRTEATEIYRQLRGALASKPDGFFIQITTQSAREPVGIFRKELNNARNVRDGVYNQPLLPILYEYPEEWVLDERWRDPKYWHIVNPNIDKSVSLEFLQREWSRVETESAEDQNLFASQHLNIEIGMRLADDNWIAAEDWPDNIDKDLTLDKLIERCGVITAGVDGGGKDDLMGLCILGREKGGDRWYCWVKAWCFPSVFTRNPNYADALRGFEADGDLVVCEHPTQDLTGVANTISKCSAKLPRKGAIGVDVSGLGDIVTELLTAGGVSKDQIVSIPQGGWLSPAIVTAERKLMRGNLIHAGQPLMNWCMGNVRVERRGMNWSITKDNSVGKIDPVAAMLNSIAIMKDNPLDPINLYAEQNYFKVI